MGRFVNRAEQGPRIERVVSWEHQRGDTVVTDIDGLGLGDDTFRSIGQDTTVGITPAGELLSVGYPPLDEAQWEPTPRGSRSTVVDAVGDPTFFKCGALVLQLPETGNYLFAHLGSGEDLLRGALSQVPLQRWQERRRAVIVAGTHSTWQRDVEGYLREERFGPVDVSSVLVDTGECQWGALFYPKTGDLAVVRKTPDHSIAWLKPFPGGRQLPGSRLSAR